MHTKRNHKLLLCLSFPVFIMLIGWLVVQLSFRTILSNAVSEAFDEMKENLLESPVYILTDVLWSKQGNTIDADLSLSDTLIGDVHAKMNLFTRDQKLKASGTLSALDTESDFSIYLDQNVLAVSSNLLNNEYYGITFDTFTQDLRQIPMISWVVKEDTIKEWDNSLKTIRKEALRNRYLPDLSKVLQFSELDLKGLFLLLPVQITRTEIVQNKSAVPATRMVYEFHGDQIPEYIKSTFSLDATENIEVSASFYIQKKELIIGDIEIQENNDIIKIILEKDCAGSADSGHLRLLMKGSGRAQEVSVDFENNDIRKEEQWSFSAGKNAVQTVSITWESESGEMTLSDDAASVFLIFRRAENGFSLETEEMAALIKIIGKATEENYSGKASGKVVVTKGGNPQKPEYKNLDQWSFEDFLTLLDGISSMIGWNLP